MTRKIALALALALALGAATLTVGTTLAANAPPAASQEVRSALLAALDDEYRAEAVYQSVLDRHGDVRPFSNIIRAEQRHQEMVKAELDARGWTFAANPYSGKIKAPASLLEACQIGVRAEIDNIALYDRLLPNVSDPAAKTVLERLQWASRENHLPAFERCVSRGGMAGRGPGGGGFWGW